MATREERRKKRQEELRQQAGEHQAERETRFAQIEQQQKRSKIKVKLWVFGSIAVLLLVIAGFIIDDRIAASRPGKYDNFAKCLTEKGAVMYGAIEWCEYTQAQAKMFGNSFKYVNYQNYRELPGIKKTPTWVINGERYERVQSFRTLSELTGCKIDGE